MIDAEWGFQNFLESNVEEYLQYAEDINTMADDVYRYLNFNEMENYTTAANKAFPVMVA